MLLFAGVPFADPFELEDEDEDEDEVLDSLAAEDPPESLLDVASLDVLESLPAESFEPPSLAAPEAESLPPLPSERLSLR